MSREGPSWVWWAIHTRSPSTPPSNSCEGGKARMAALSPEARSALGRAAIAKRWPKKKRAT
jgi:hypothetical protein